LEPAEPIAMGSAGSKIVLAESFAQVPACDDDGIIAVELAFLHEAGGIERVRQADERVGAELLVFRRDGGHERQILRGNDLVGVNVVANDVNGAGKLAFHRARMWGGRAGFSTGIWMGAG